MHENAKEIQAYDMVILNVPIDLSIEIREEIVRNLNQTLADSMTLRDLYKKYHWQVSGATFYPLHLLFDKHHAEQSDLVDRIAERVQTLGGISIAMGHHVSETTMIPRAPRGREDVRAQFSRLLEAHELIIKEGRRSAHRAQELGDEVSTDLLVSGVLRTNEKQVWVLSGHQVNVPRVAR
jgi:starvation-inducible DNA-binding protein